MNSNVLIVDDSASIRALVASVAESLGFTVLLATNGEEALGELSRHPVDLVVLDVEMPGINGFETCRLIRKLRQEWFPVIYLSGHSNDESVVQGLDAGGDVYVFKPINARVLESVMRSMGRISDMKQALRDANQQLQKLAYFDGLTEVMNRRGFDETLKRYWLQSKREQSSLSLLMLDVDHFKKFNDSCGHMEGDQCLKRVARALEQTVLRPGDIVARYGGEEFAVILMQTGIEGAEVVAAKILAAIRGESIPHPASPVASHVTVSIGVSSSASAPSVDDLIREADEALYRAKSAGRNQAQRFVVKGSAD